MRMLRGGLMAGLALAWSAAGSISSTAAQSPKIGKPIHVPPTPMAPLPPAEIDNTLAIGGEDINARKSSTRMTVEVMVNGRGPYRFLVDSGAVYTVLPEPVWKSLGLEPDREAEFVLADGTTVHRGVAEARFTIAGVAATSPVVCGEGRDGALLGAVTLETLGLMLNPLSREVLPMRLPLARTVRFA